MHQLILDNIEIVLILIVIAHGLLFYTQSCIYTWAKNVYSSIIVFMNLSIEEHEAAAAIKKLGESQSPTDTDK